MLKSHRYFRTILLEFKEPTISDYETDLMNGNLRKCLQELAFVDIKAIFEAAGYEFSEIARAKGRLTQMEFTYAPNIDGYSVMDDPIKLLKQGKVMQKTR